MSCDIKLIWKFALFFMSWLEITTSTKVFKSQNKILTFNINCIFFIAKEKSFKNTNIMLTENFFIMFLLFEQVTIFFFFSPAFAIREIFLNCYSWFIIMYDKLTQMLNIKSLLALNMVSLV